MKKYRKKPAIIEAIQCKYPTDPKEIASWCGGEVCGIGKMDEKRWIEIETLEGTMKASYGDWIIKGVRGEFYPCKPDIFDMTYEEVLNE